MDTLTPRALTIRLCHRSKQKKKPQLQQETSAVLGGKALTIRLCHRSKQKPTTSTRSQCRFGGKGERKRWDADLTHDVARVAIRLGYGALHLVQRLGTCTRRRGSSGKASTTCRTTAGRDESKRELGKHKKGNSPGRALATAESFYVLIPVPPMAEAIMRKDAAICLSCSRELQAAMEERLGFRGLLGGFWGFGVL